MGGSSSKLPKVEKVVEGNSSGKIKNAKILAASVGGNLAIGMILGQLAMPAIKNWYSKLKKPEWTPPKAVFGPVWTVLYACMGVASWMVYNKGGFGQPGKPLAIYGAQLLLNFAWQPLFFNAKKLDVALVDSTLLLGASVATTVAFSKVDTKAAWLMAPTIPWVLYATALLFEIKKQNPDADKIDTGGSSGEGPKDDGAVLLQA